jgi:hypothetical protein
MENLQLIMVTVLITLLSGALVGSLIYLGVVVRNLRRTVKNNLVDITDLQNSLNNEVINIYNRIDDVEKSLLEVVKDGKIDSNDLPYLILLIQKLYEIVYAVKDIKLDGNKRALISAELLKFISHYLIIERRIEIANDIQSQFLDQIDKLIDSCVGLLSFSKSIKVRGCFKSIFA